MAVGDSVVFFDRVSLLADNSFSDRVSLSAGNFFSDDVAAAVGATVSRGASAASGPRSFAAGDSVAAGDSFAAGDSVGAAVLGGELLPTVVGFGRQPTSQLASNRLPIATLANTNAPRTRLSKVQVMGMRGR